MTDGATLPTFAAQLRATFMYHESSRDGVSARTDNSSHAGPTSARSVRILRSRQIPLQSGNRKVDEVGDEDVGDTDAQRTGELTHEEVIGADQRGPMRSPRKRRNVEAGHRVKAATTTTTSPKTKPKPRRAKAAQKYAPPETYAHLPLLPDAIGPNLLVQFVGLNPGLETARTGHAYAHPSNMFWKLMHRSGVTPVVCRADEDQTLPARFRLGLTNIVARPTRNGAELRPAELDAGVALLEAKARRWRPEVMCFVGKGIWDSIVRVRYGAGGPRCHLPRPAFCYGWQDPRENMGVLSLSDRDGPDVAPGVHIDPSWSGARVFVATSTSGLAASLSPTQKEAVWRQLGEWVEQRRAALAEEAMAQADPGEDAYIPVDGPCCMLLDETFHDT